LLRDETKGAFMAKRQDDLDPPQAGERSDSIEDTTRGTGTDDLRGIATDEDDDEFDDDDDLDDAEDDDSEDL
jgi:hypothetical protein